MKKLWKISEKSGTLQITKIYIHFLKAYIKMKKTIIKFDDVEIQKQKIDQHKRPI